MWQNKKSGMWKKQAANGHQQKQVHERATKVRTPPQLQQPLILQVFVCTTQFSKR